MRIDKLKLLHDSGLMSDEEFEVQRQRLISEV
ncbi:MAG: SHOCT domain-containing protein [Coriobacteriales bacterium]